MASAGEVELTVVPEASAFGSLLLGQIGKQLGPLETGVSKLVSGVLGNALPLAFLAAGAAATKMASDYEDALGKIEGLVGLTHEQTVKLGEDMLNLSKTIPVAPQELAKAMFFIESAGLRGSRAMDALTASAKASAAGLGDIETIADAVTSAMNSYAQSGLSAGEATDVMIAAVREGKLPPEELAASLGQVLPVASSMGVEFYEVAAAIAASTRQGLSAARAATGVRFLLTSFIKPSAQAVEALGGVGISIEELQKRVDEQGLQKTLEFLAKKFDLTTAAGKQMFAQVVGGARGLSVANILIGQNQEAVEKLTESIKNSAGSTEKAFGVAMKLVSNQIKLLITNIQATAIAIGTVLLPIVTAFIHILSAVLSPVLGFVADHAKVLLEILLGYAALKAIPAIIGLIVSAVTGLGDAFVALQTKSTLALGNLKLWSAGLMGMIESMGGLAAVAGPAALAIGAVAVAFIGFKIASDAAHRAFEAGVKKDLQALKVGLDPVNKSISTAAKGVFEAVSHINEAFVTAPIAARGVGGAMTEVRETTEQAAEALRRLPHPVETVSDAFKAGLITFEQYHDALIAVIGTEAVYAQDSLRAIIATGHLTDAQRQYYQEIGKNAVTAQKFQKDLDAAVLAGRITWEQYASAVAGANLEMNVSQEAFSHTAIAAESTVNGLKHINDTMQELHPTFDALGLDFDEFEKGARDAAHKGTAAFQEFSQKTLAQVSDAIDQMSSDISDSLNFTDDALQELGDSAKNTGEDYLKAFREAAKETKAFGRDLLEISHHGGAELARTLVGMGEAGVNAARAIAAETPKMQRKIIEAFGSGETAADKLATKLTKQIAGSLDTIAGILKKLAKAWGIDVNVKGDAQNEIATIQDHVNQLVAHDYEIRIQAHEVKGSPLPSELIKQLTKKLEDLTEDPWGIKVKAEFDPASLTKGLNATQKTLDKIAQIADKVFGEEFPKAYEKDVKAFEKATNEKVAGFNKKMSELTKNFDKLTEKVNNFRDAIKSGFSGVSDLVGGALDAIQKHQEMLADLKEQGWVGEDWGADLGGFLAGQISSAKDFATKLAQLSAAGLAPAVLAEIASQGPEALPLVDALLQGGEGLIKQFNDTQKTIAQFANATADALGDAHFGGAIKKAKNQIENLNQSIDHFVNQFSNHTSNLADAIDKLAHSLNQSIAQLNGKVPKAAAGGIVTKPTLLLAGEAGPEAIVPLTKGGGVGGDTVNVYLTVEGNAVYSHDLADEVRDILLKDKRYKRTLGLS